MPRPKSEDIRNQAIKIFHDHGGILKTSEAMKAGIHPRILYELRDEGLIERLEEGLYGLPGLPDIGQPDFVLVHKRVPKGVVCLVSALYFHNLTLQIPKCVDIAVRQKYRTPLIQYPPVHFHWYSDAYYEEGIEIHQIDSFPIKIYSMEKTIVDCFKHRNKIGIDVAIEAFRNYWELGNPKIEVIRAFAVAARILKKIEPYIQSVAHE